MANQGQYIFRAWITVKGERIYAKNYGKRAFRIYVGPKKGRPKGK